MAMQPGPRQVFPSNISRISFPTVGGLVFFRATQRFVGKGSQSEPAPQALVKGLPWGDFDMFALGDQEKVDPDSAEKGSVSITDPVTPKMLSKYLYWRHKPPVHVVNTVTEPPASFRLFVIDTAGWTPIIRGNIAFRVTPTVTREEAIAQYISIFSAEGLIPSLFSADEVKVTVINNIGHELTEAEFIAVAPAAGWTYHYEDVPYPPVTTKRADDAAIVILNLQKLYRDVPLVAGKKPTTFKFKVFAPANPYTAPGTGVSFTWGLDASAWIPKVTNPPKDKQRVSFPVESTADVYLNPTFPHPDSNASVGAGSSGGEEAIDVTITFGAAGVAPKVELAGGSGGGSSDEG